MKLILLIDFGSTYTKVTAVDLETAEVAATVKAPTTVYTDIMEGLNGALEKLREALSGTEYTVVERLASSSAAGGLRMDAIGLVPELTAKAARDACLNSGAKLVGVYSYELTDGDLRKIEDGRSDIILLAGGTDGGNRDVILHNARMLAGSGIAAPVIVAGNRNCCDEICGILRAGGKEPIPTENVLPKINMPNIEPVRREIRELFIHRIIQAKGIERATSYVEKILMPTPTAVLKGATLLSQGTSTVPGIGELVLIDIGGATTDVHSVAVGDPSKPGMISKGIPEAFAKRTVEGDMGVRWNARSIVEEVGLERFAAAVGLAPETVSDWVERITANTELLAETETERKIDAHLAHEAARISMARHTGYIETHHTLMGVIYALYGKDLTTVRNIVGTGGPLVHSPDPAGILSAAAYRPEEPEILRPENPAYYVDGRYILYAGGLLSEAYPDLAVRMMKKYLVRLDPPAGG